MPSTYRQSSFQNPIISKLKTFFVLLFTLLMNVEVLAQCGPPAAANCQAIPASELMLSTSSNAEMRFDEFSDYIAGLTLSGSTMLRLKVAANNASCKWALRVYIENNPASGTPVNEWETLQTYGGTSTAPGLEKLGFRVYNGCGTPINSGTYQYFPAVNGGYIDIVNDIALIPAGSCVTNVNGAGSYLTHYNEFNFVIDYRIIPGLNYSAGVYQVNLHFCLVEQL